MTKRIALFLTLTAALPLFAAQDVLTIGKISATTGSTVTVPVYLRDVSGTALGADAGAGNRIQGIMLQVVATPSVAGMSITFEKTGPLGATPLYQRGGSGRWIGAWSESSQILPFNTGAASPGDRIGSLRITLPVALNGNPSVALTFNPATTMLSNEAGTVIESVANRHLQLVAGSVSLSGASTSTTLSSTPNPSLAGNNVTFTANITSAAPSIGGSVIFTEGGQIVGSAIVQSGQATWSTSSLSAGSHTIFATYEGDATHLTSTSGSVQQVVNIPLDPPANVAATAASPTQVVISWSPATNAQQYQVWRKAPGGSYTVIGTLPDLNFTDQFAEAGKTYFYRVRSLASSSSSTDSVADHATTVIFTDDALVAGTTTVKLVHLTELRTAVNAFVYAAGVPPTPIGGSASAIVKSHLTEMRNYLQQGRMAAGLPSMSFTDANPTTIKAVHFQEIRAAVK